MNNKKVIKTPYFVANIAFYIRKKKYTKIDSDTKPVMDLLKQGQLLGDIIPNLNIPEGTHVYKVRVPNSSAGVGKSNGFRILYYATIGDTVYLLSIYSKRRMMTAFLTTGKSKCLLIVCCEEVRLWTRRIFR